MKNKNWIVTIIVLSQFSCISLWFAGNAVMEDLMIDFDLKANALGHLTSAVQFGFIIGTLLFAILTISDRFSPSRVFFVNAILGALVNALIILQGNTYASLLLLRFLTGFFLAGIYPVGMKIAADHFSKTLGVSLGFLVGALTLGTGFPHILRNFTSELPWKTVIVITSLLAVLGGMIILLFVKDGPYREKSKEFDVSVFMRVFRKADFRSAAFGYFGHMWELYALWTFIPIILYNFQEMHSGVNLNIPALSFIIISSGGVACVISGYISLRVGTKKTAFTALLLSGLCCILSPILFQIDNPVIFITFMVFWGMVVVADSPLFSTLVAQNVAGEAKGTALTIVNSIGFSITILSIQLLNSLSTVMRAEYMFLLLAAGPLFGLIALKE